MAKAANLSGKRTVLKQCETENYTFFVLRGDKVQGFLDLFLCIYVETWKIQRKMRDIK